MLNFADGQTVANIPITIIDDTAIEPEETINFSISGPTGGATITTPSSATVTIHDNDGSQPTGLLPNEVVVDPPHGHFKGIL